MSEEDIYIGGTSIQIGQHGFINQPKEIIEYIKYLQNQLQQKENIIKEVREWANKTIFYFDFEEEITKHAFDLLYTKQGQELLEILKGSDKEWVE